MSQSDFGNLSSPLSGTALIDTYLEPWRDALHSTHSGTSRPSYAAAGTLWLDTTTTPWVLKMFDGTDDITIGKIDATTNLFTPAVLGTIWCGSSGGTANAQTFTPTRAITALVTGQAYEGIFTLANTAAAPTINISAVGAATVKVYQSGGKVNAPIGSLQGIGRFVYDGTDLILINLRPHNKGAAIATASTLNLDNATGDYVHLTGTTTVTAITLAEGREVTCVADGAFTLTDGTANSPQGIIIPGAANLSVAAGDVFKVRGEGGGTVRVYAYTVANAVPGSVGGGLKWLGSYTASNATSVDIGSGQDVDVTIDGTYDHYIAEVIRIVPQTDNTFLYVQTDSNAGASVDAGATDYGDTSDSINEGTQSQTADIDDSVIQCGGFAFGTGTGEVGHAIIHFFDLADTTKYKIISGHIWGYNQAGQQAFTEFSGSRKATAAIDFIRLAMSSGNSNFIVHFYGVAKS